jgi:hypothetical protein
VQVHVFLKDFDKLFRSPLKATLNGILLSILFQWNAMKKADQARANGWILEMIVLENFIIEAL